MAVEPADTLQAETEPVSTEAAPVEEVPEYYAYSVDGIELIPGQPFDASDLPEPEFTYDTPSCAFEGTDHVYGYGTF